MGIKKDDIIKIIVILIVVGFITEMFQWFGPHWQTTPGIPIGADNGTIKVIAEFNATLSEYKPYLIIKGELNKTTEDAIKTDKRVEDIIKNPEGSVVSIKKKEDVFEVYTSIKAMDVSATTDAKINLPYFIEMTLDNGSSMNVSSSGMAITSRIEPLAKPPSVIKIKMTAIVKDGVIVGYQSLSLVPEKITLYLNGTIKDVYSNVFLYSIPWEMRDNINIEDLKAEYGMSNVNYSKNNYILFKRDLTASEIQEKKNLTYVVMITDKSALINESFTTKEKIIKDFGDIVNFPNSMLRLEANETPQLNYSKQEFHYYLVNVNATAYSLLEELKAKSSKKYNISDNVTLEIEGLAVGQQLINIANIKIK